MVMCAIVSFAHGNVYCGLMNKAPGFFGYRNCWDNHSHQQQHRQ